MATPEWKRMPSSRRLVQSVRESKVILVGPPRSGSKATSHETGASNFPIMFMKLSIGGL
jgi:hypothetical protein